MVVELESCGVCEECGFPTAQRLECDESIVQGHLYALGWDWEIDEAPPLSELVSQCENCEEITRITIDISYARLLIEEYHAAD